MMREMKVILGLAILGGKKIKTFFSESWLGKFLVKV